MAHGDTKARRACINYSASLRLCVLNLKPGRIFRSKNKKSAYFFWFFARLFVSLQATTNKRSTGVCLSGRDGKSYYVRKVLRFGIAGLIK